MQLWYDEAFKMLHLKAMNSAGSLQVSVVEGRKIVPKQTDGTLDSYVVLELEHEQVQTCVMLHNLNPDWLADFKLDVHFEDSHLLVFVYEARSPQASGLIGKGSVRLRDFVDVGTNVQWVILKDANGAKTDAYDLKFQGVAKVPQPPSPRKGSPRKSALPKTLNSSTESSRLSSRAPQLVAAAAAHPPPPLLPLKAPEVEGPPPIPQLQVSRPPSPPLLPRNKLLAIAGATAGLLLAMFAIKYRNQSRKRHVGS